MASFMSRFLLNVKNKYLFDCYQSISLINISRNCVHNEIPGSLIGNVRRYSRKGQYRRPLRVIIPGQGSIETDDDAIQNKMHQLEDQKRAEKLLYDNNVISKDPGIPHYIKLKEKTHVFVSAVNLAKSRKLREKKRKFLLEGKRLIREALNAGVKVDSLFFSQEEILKDLPLLNIPDLKLYKVMYKDLSIWSDLTTSPGIMGIFTQPDFGKLSEKMETNLPLTVICDNIREPGNLGAILRCVAAAGCRKVLLTRGCVDVWEPKVLRAGCGAQFQIAMHNNVGWELVGNHLTDECMVYLASNEPLTELPTEYGDVKLPGPHQRAWYEVTEDGQIMDPAYSSRTNMESFARLPIMRLPYFDMRIDANQKEFALIVGGETEGLSDAAHKFVRDRGGQLVYIPMRNNIESLNSAVALGIILFEIQKKFCNNNLDTNCNANRGVEQLTS